MNWGHLFFRRTWNPTGESQQPSSRNVGSTRMPKLLATVRLSRSQMAGSSPSVRGRSLVSFGIFRLSKPMISTGLKSSITYTFAYSITLWPESRASYNATGKPRYLMRSGLAFLHTLISITVAKPTGKFCSGAVKICGISVKSSTWHWQQQCTPHCPITERCSREHSPAFGHWFTGVLWYNTEPTQLRLSTV